MPDTATPERTADSSHELINRHRLAARIVSFLITFTLLLVLLSVAGIYPSMLGFDQNLSMALRIAILFCGLGAVALRRARFNFTRLRDTAAVGGMSALLASLQKTTLIVAALGGAIALMGYLIFSQTGRLLDALLPCLAGIAVLLFSYPRRAVWRRTVQIIKELESSGAATDAPTKGSVA
jgi:hypothetical protein